MTCGQLIGLSRCKPGPPDSYVLIRQRAAVLAVSLQQRRYLGPKDHTITVEDGDKVLRTESVAPPAAPPAAPLGDVEGFFFIANDQVELNVHDK